MGNKSLDLFLNNFNVDNGLYKKARELLSYAALYSALACGGDGVDGPKPPPTPTPGKPSVSLSPSPMQGVGSLESMISVSGSPGANTSIREVTVDYDGNGTITPDERFTSIPPSRQVKYTNDGNNPLQRIIVTTLTNSNGDVATDSKTIIIMPYNKTSGAIFEIDDITGLIKGPLSGATVLAGGATAITGADGKYSINNATQAIYQIAISKNVFQTYTTYKAYSLNADTSKGDFGLIPSSIIEDVNYMLRLRYGLPGSPVVNVPLDRWEIQPEYNINTTDYNAEQITFLEDWLMSDRIEKLTNGFLKRAASRDAIKKISSDLTGSGLEGKWVFSRGTGNGVKEFRFKQNDQYNIRGVNVMTSAGDTNLLTEYNTTHESERAVGLETPQPGTWDFQNSLAGVGREYTPNLLRAINISYTGLRPPGSMAPDNDPIPTSSASLMQSNINAARYLKANSNQHSYKTDPSHNNRK